MSKDSSKKALQSLSKLRQLPASNPRIKLEHLGIQAKVLFHKEITAERHPRLEDRSRSSAIQLEIMSRLNCFRRGCWRRTHVSVILIFFQRKELIKLCKPHLADSFHHRVRWDQFSDLHESQNLERDRSLRFLIDCVPVLANPFPDDGPEL